MICECLLPEDVTGLDDTVELSIAVRIDPVDAALVGGPVLE